MFDFATFLLVLGITGPGDRLIDARTIQDYNHLRMPAHATMHKGVLYGFFNDDWAQSEKNGRPIGSPSGVDRIPLGKIAKSNWTTFPLFSSGGNNLRHHAGFGALWYSRGPSFLNRLYFDEVQKREADDRMRASTDPPAITGIFLLELMEKRRKMWRAADPTDNQKHGAVPGEDWRPPVEMVAYDSVPISRIGCKTFMLIKKEKKFEAWDTQEVELDPITRQFKNIAAVQNLESFDSPFLDDFYAFIRKNNYYFVTESGMLYHAPPRKEGTKSRTMNAIWGDVKQPIAAIIEDADSDKVWLFTKNKRKDETQAVFFEMSPDIRTEKFDHAKLAPVNVEGRAKILLEYLPLIRDKAKKQKG